MRSLLIVVAGLSLVGAALLSDHSARKLVPTIGVKIVERDAWSGGTVFLPMVKGYSGGASSSSSADGGYYVNASYQVASTSPGHFFVLAHYKIMREGSQSVTEVDKALPVEPAYHPSPLAEEKLKQANWTTLDDHLSAFAYVSDDKTGSY